MHKKWCGSSVAAAFGIAAVALFGSGYARAQESAPPMPPLPPGSPGAPPISPVILTAPPIERGEGVVPAPRSIIRIGNAEYASDQVIVTFKSDITSEQLSQFARAHNLTSRFRSKILGYVFTLPEGTDVQQVVSRLKDHPLVRRVGMNGIGRGGSVTPTDQYYSSGAQWHLDKISMPQAWARTMGDWNYAIAVLDSGVQSAHPDLNSKLGRYPNGDLLGFNAISGVQYPDPGYYPEDDHGHGTAVIGVAGAATTFSGLPGSGNGVAGVSPNAPIVPVKVLNSNNFGLTPWIANGILDAITIGNVRILNMSLYGIDPSADIKDALHQATLRNVLPVGITGNNQNLPKFPGAYWRLMAVGATDINDNLTGYSVIGPSVSLPQISVVAPGGSYLNQYPGAPNGLITTTFKNPPYNSYDSGWGTSLAAPQVAGLAHLVLSMFPTMTWYDLKSRIEDTAWDLNGSTGFPGYDQYIGWGRVDAERATRFESRNVSVSVRPGVYQLVSIGMWPGGLPGGTKAQDWGALFGPALTDPSGPHGFRAYWWDTESRAYVDYTDYRAPRVGAGRSYWVRFNPGFDGSGNPLPPAPSAYTITNTLGGAYPFMQAGHPVVTHLLPRTPDPAGGTHTLIGTPGQDPVAWNRQTIKVLVPQPDGTGQIMTLQQAKNLNFVEQYATRWNAQTQGYEIVAEPGTPNLPPGYPVVSSMQPGEGYFLHSNVECLLLLPKN